VILGRLSFGTARDRVGRGDEGRAGRAAGGRVGSTPEARLAQPSASRELCLARGLVRVGEREGQRNASASRHPAVDQHAVHASSHRPMDRATLAKEAYRHLESGQHLGKVVIRV
jgi:hypothetical protein